MWWERFFLLLRPNHVHGHRWSCKISSFSRWCFCHVFVLHTINLQGVYMSLLWNSLSTELNNPSKWLVSDIKGRIFEFTVFNPILKQRELMLGLFWLREGEGLGWVPVSLQAIIWTGRLEFTFYLLAVIAVCVIYSYFWTNISTPFDINLYIFAVALKPKLSRTRQWDE